MSVDIVTIGKAMRDIILQTDTSKLNDTYFKEKKKGKEKNDQEKHLVENSFLEIGGGAANTAVSLVKLGFKTAPTAAIGDDAEAKEILERLERRGVETELLVDIQNESSGISVIIEGEDKEHEVFVYPGVNRLLDLDMFQWTNLNPASFWYLLSLGNPDPAILSEIARRKEDQNVRLAFNPGQLQLNMKKKELTPILEAVDILFVNEFEAYQLTGEKGDEVFKKLVGMGPKIVVVTYGPEGAGCYGGKEIIKAPARSTEKVNALGCGDAFGSAFLAGFINSGNIKEALKWGIVNSSHVLTEYGAQKGLLTKGEIKDELNEKDVKVEKVS